MRRVWRETQELVGAVYTLLIFLPCLSAYSSGECYFNAKANCEYQGEVFDMGDSWMTKDCYLCTCMGPFGIGCCEQSSQPVDYPEWCEVVRRPNSCKIAVVMRANHKVPCLYGGWSKMRPWAREDPEI